MDQPRSEYVGWYREPRTRQRRRHDEFGERPLRQLLTFFLLLTVGGCSLVTGVGDDLIQLVVVSPSGGIRVEEGDTTRLVAYGVTKSGDSVAPDITWEEITSSGRIVLDGVTGEIVGVLFGTTLVQARAGSLRSDPLDVSVLAAADTVRPGGSSVDTVTTTEIDSSPLGVVVESFNVSDTTALAERPVTFTLVSPVSPTVDIQGEAQGVVTVTRETDAEGQATVVLSRRSGTTAPDSVVIEATALRANGQTVPGSPVRLVVYFQP